MNIYELFEQHYADHNDTTAQNVKSCRLSNGSYNNLPIARAFRMFKAGFEANEGDKLQLLGYFSTDCADGVLKHGSACINRSRTAMHNVEVFVKQCDTLKPEMNHE